MSNNEYDNIDFRINTLYNAMYNKEDSSNYIFKPIVKNNISLINIKEPLNFDLTEIFKSDIKYIGKYNNKWIFKRTSDSSYPCTITIGKYNKNNTNNNDLTRSELYNPAIHYILSELSITENFKHVLLPLMFSDVSEEYLKKSKDVYEILKSEITKDTQFYMFISEHYFKMESLKDFIKSEYKNI
jgi:hypothetical protein